MKVLVLADDCNPEWPSLPIVAYKYVKSLAELVDVTVVTQIRNRPNIEKHGFGRAHVEYLDSEAVADPMGRLAALLRRDPQKAWTLQTALDYPAYLWFEYLAWRKFGRALRAGEFDLVHRVSPMSPTLPSLMAGWSPVPFVMGPLNGNLPWPSAFNAEQTREREGLSRYRNLYKYLPFSASSYRHSRAILAAFQHTVDDVPVSDQIRAINFPEVGIDPEVFSPKISAPGAVMDILYVGRLVPYKLPEILVHAVAGSPLLRQHRTRIVGGGPDHERLQALISELDVGQCITLTGSLPQTEVGRIMRSSDIFAFPSIRELGAGVVVEAMACGLACVVVDYGGPGTLIAEDRGIKVPLGTFAELVERFRNALEGLVQDPARVARLGRAAHDHAMAHYTWEKKARKTLEIYEWVSRQTTPKPDFWLPA